jgi:hypothetical protein
LLDSCTWEVQGVGGERGKKVVWLQVPRREGVAGARHLIDGETAVCFTFERGGTTYLAGLLRLEAADGKVSRIVNYGFCGDTMAYVAGQLGLEPAFGGYHQAGPILDAMIANAQLPWDPDET